MQEKAVRVAVQSNKKDVFLDWAVNVSSIRLAWNVLLSASDYVCTVWIRLLMLFNLQGLFVNTEHVALLAAKLWKEDFL